MPLACSAACLVTSWLAPAFRYTSASENTSANWLQIPAISALTAQFAHLDTAHLLLNLIGLWLVCWGLRPWRTPGRDALFLASGLAGVWVGLLLSPGVAWYCGLSGALHGVFAAGVLHVLMTDERRAVKGAALVLIGGGLLKLLLEDEALWTGLRQSAGGEWLHRGAALMTNRVEPLTGVLPPAASDLTASQPVLYPAHRWGFAAGAATGLLAGLQWIRQHRKHTAAP